MNVKRFLILSEDPPPGGTGGVGPHPFPNASGYAIGDFDDAEEARFFAETNFRFYGHLKVVDGSTWNGTRVKVLFEIGTFTPPTVDTLPEEYREACVLSGNRGGEHARQHAALLADAFTRDTHDPAFRRDTESLVRWLRWKATVSTSVKASS